MLQESCLEVLPIVPGWIATYWVKHLISIDVAAKPFDGFWMKTAYHIRHSKFPVVDRLGSQETETNTPIGGEYSERKTCLPF